MTSFRKIRVPLFPLCWFSHRMLWAVCRLMIFLGFLMNRQFTATENLKEIFPIHSSATSGFCAFGEKGGGSEPHHSKYGLQTGSVGVPWKFMRSEGPYGPSQLWNQDMHLKNIPRWFFCMWQFEKCWCERHKYVQWAALWIRGIVWGFFCLYTSVFENWVFKLYIFLSLTIVGEL